MWDNFLQDHHWYNQDQIFSIILNIALFVLIVACVSPMAIMDGIGTSEKIIGGVTGIGKKNFLYKLACDQVAPIYLMVFNYIFVPFVVNKATGLMTFQLKSNVHTSLVWKFYTYYIFITIIL